MHCNFVPFLGCAAKHVTTFSIRLRTCPQLLQEFVGADLRNIRGQVLTPGSSSRRPARHQFMDSTGLSDSKSTGASMISSVDDLSYVDSAAMTSTSRPAEVGSSYKNILSDLKKFN